MIAILATGMVMAGDGGMASTAGTLATAALIVFNHRKNIATFLAEQRNKCK
jgi:hypothetical protein